jgi:hypothetical protein
MCAMAENPVDHPELADERRSRLVRLADGYLVTQLLHVVVTLGVPDRLAGGPRRSDDLAREVGVVPDLLRRVLRGLATEGVVDELPGDRFALTAVGELLRTGVAGSVRGAVAARGQVYYDAAAGLLDAVRTGGSAFERVHGRSFFALLGERPDRLGAFLASMADRSAREADGVVDAYDFSRFGSIVDVGGGTGVLLRRIRERAPQAELVLFDRPEVVAGTDLPSAGGDFFAAVPPGADAYVLSRVLHDWDDDAATRLLRTCRAAMRPDATLVVVEALVPERAVDDPDAVRMDLHMLALLGGRERDVTEYAALLAAAGLRLAAAVPTGAGVHVLEARCA